MSSTQPPSSQTPAGWYPAEGGNERYWNGQEWTNQMRPAGPPSGPPQGHYQQGPPPKKSHTLRNVLLVLLLLVLLAIGGCFALVGGVANEVDKSMKQERANDKPTDVREGQAFSHDGYKVASGWKLANQFGTATIRGLKVTNVKNDEMTGNGGRTALLTFRLYKGSNNLAEITCTGKELQEGESSKMDCGSGDKMPKKFDAIRVADAF